MSESDDYKRGWFDGFNAAKQHNPLFPQPMPYMPSPTQKPNIKCDKCGMIWEGAMGYVCPRHDCAVQPKVS